MEIKIEKLVFEGKGFGRALDGRPVFVYKAIPGDELEVKITKDKKSFLEGKIKHIIEPGPSRIKPACPNFEQCGGCEHQNIAYLDQLKFKEAIFKEVLERAKVQTKIEPILAGSKEEFFYRNVLRFFMQTNNENNLEFAMHNFDYKNGLVILDQCLLQSKTSNQILAIFKNFIDQNIDDKSSFWQLRIREGKFTDEIMVEIITTNHTLPEEQGIVVALKKIPEIKSIYHSFSRDKDLNNLRRRLIFGSPVIYEKIGKFRFQISPESFFQTNSLGVEILYNKIKEFADVKIGERVLDLFCGTGTIGLYLSTLAKEIVGVEVVPEAVRDANDNAKINRIHNCKFICADASNIKNLRLEIKDFSVIILDPPRSGLAKELILQLSAAIVHQRIVYVSCNPATFARDIKIFAENGLDLEKVQPIDMFPQTHHIECVGIIKKALP